MNLTLAGYTVAIKFLHTAAVQRRMHKKRMSQETATVSDGYTGTIILRPQHRGDVRGSVMGAPAAIHDLPMSTQCDILMSVVGAIQGPPMDIRIKLVCRDAWRKKARGTLTDAFTL